MSKIISIKKSSDFKIIQKNAHKKHALSIILLQHPTLINSKLNNKFVDDNQNFNCRFGITISKKIHKSAVVRNKIKRRIKNILKELLPIISKSNYDYIIIAKQQILELDYNKIYNDIKRLLIN